MGQHTSAGAELFAQTTTGAELVYSGRAAGSDWTANGVGSNLLCLPDDPDYLNGTADSVQNHSPLTGAEFHT